VLGAGDVSGLMEGVFAVEGLPLRSVVDERRDQSRRAAFVQFVFHK
jgi:hypothetical protein